MVSFVVHNKLEAFAALQALNRLQINGKIIIYPCFLKSVDNFITGTFLFIEILFLFGINIFKKHKNITVVFEDDELIMTLNNSFLVIDFVGVNLKNSKNLVQVISDNSISYVGVRGALLSEVGTNYKIISENGSNVDVMRLSNSSIMANNLYVHTLKISSLLLKKYFV